MRVELVIFPSAAGVNVTYSCKRAGDKGGLCTSVPVETELLYDVTVCADRCLVGRQPVSINIPAYGQVK